MSAVDGQVLGRRADSSLMKFLRRHRLTHLSAILCKHFPHNKIVQHLYEARKTELSEWVKLSDDSGSGNIQLRSGLLYLFQRDLLCSSPHRAVLDIVTKAEEAVFRRRVDPPYPPPYSRYNMYGWIYLVVGHVCMLVYIFVNGFFQSMEYQYAALVTLILWTMADLLIVSTVSALLMHCVAPLYIMQYVYRATDKCYQHFSGCRKITDEKNNCENEDRSGLVMDGNENNEGEDGDVLGSVISLFDVESEEKAGGNTGGDSDGDRKWSLMDTIYDFNALQYYFVSARSAVQCSHLRESKVVSDLSSLFLDHGSDDVAEFYSRSNRYMYEWIPARQGLLRMIIKKIWTIVETVGLGCWLWCHAHVSTAIGEIMAESVSIVVAFAVLILHLKLGLGFGDQMFSLDNVPFSLLVFGPTLFVVLILCIAACIDVYSTQKWLRYRSDLYRLGPLLFFPHYTYYILYTYIGQEFVPPYVEKIRRVKHKILFANRFASFSNNFENGS